MKIELEIDEKDLTETISALNNAILAYKDIRNAMFFYLDYPIKWKFLQGDTEDTLTEKIDNRLNLLCNIYNQLIKYENNGSIE